VVLVEDECRVAKESDAAAVWYEKGKYPQIKVDAKREGKSFYGALNVKNGKCHLTEIKGKQISERTVEHLEYLEKVYRGKRVLLIWDGAPWHRGKVKEYLERKNKKFWIELMYFPPYSPDFNPQEHVWKLGKKHACHNSEEPFETRIKKFKSFIRRKKFKNNFLKKYT
jgi:transposase